MTKKTMKYAEEFNVQLNLDSPNQLNQWLTLFPDKAVGIRCNIGDKVKPYSNHAGTFIGKESRLGFTREEISQIGDKSKIKGLHLYAGTDIFDIDYLINCYKELIAIANDFSELEYLNFGGGFGVSENGEKQFNFSEFNSRVSELMNQNFDSKK
jgi:diaminopimelate decarboxylase